MPQKAAIISGASRGIGRAAAVELAGRGWALGLISRSAAELAKTEHACREAGGDALACCADITDEAALTRAVAATLERFGRLDGLVNNAGYAPQAGIEETDSALLSRTLAVNLTSAIILSRLAWPHLKASHTAGASPAAHTCIVNISSMSAVDPLPGLAAYAAAKAGLLGLTKALAREGQEHGIRSIALILGGVETEMFRGLRGAGSVPADRILTPQEVATVIADCLTGPLAYSSGEAIYLRKRI
jgi:NAD(P)-dependent dehydrogenase (short-subunit alcohol dehydrogenase family)